MPIRAFRFGERSNATLSANTTGAVLVNDGEHGLVSVRVNVANSPTGTTPSMTVFLDASFDGVNWFVVGSSAAITASGQYRFSQPAVTEPMVRIRYVVTGTTPSFTGVSNEVDFA